MTIRHYATLFNSECNGFYCTAALVMIESLLLHSWRDTARVTVLALDDRAERLTRRWAESVGLSGNVIVRPLSWLLDKTPGLSPLQSRPVRWWCCTLAAPLCRAMLGEGVDAVAYVDADCHWRSDPCALWDSLGTMSIGIVPHRFGPDREHKAVTNGEYNVSVVAFRNDAQGKACATDWTADVMSRCDEGSCGDQKYLDLWIGKYPGYVKVFHQPGVGVAPWNVYHHKITVSDPPLIDDEPVMFYHFHEARRTSDGFYRTGYPLREQDFAAFYEPWEREYMAMESRLWALG